jgi:HlyD family secretion protein
MGVWRWFPVLCTAAVLLSILGLLGCGASPVASGNSSGLTVTVTTVRPATVEQWASLAGTFAARNEAVAAVEGAGGRIQRLAVEIGDQVEAGQLIAVLDDTNVRLRHAQHVADVTRAAATRAQVAAQVAEAEADAAEAARSVARLEALAAERAVAAETIGLKRAAQLAMAARVAAAKASLAAAEADQARLKTVGDELALALARTQLTAPVSGLVATRPARVGQVVLGGEVVVTIAVDSVIEFAAEVPETILAHLAPGAPVVLSNAGGTWHGQVRRVDPGVDPLTRLGAVRVGLSVDAPVAPASVPKAPGWRIGTSARVRVRVATASGLVVPVTALIRRQGQALAVVVDETGQAHQVAVELGLDDGQQVIVTSGLSAAQRVVAQAPGFVSDGALVKVVDASAVGK